MESIAENDWTAREIGELVEFFAWMDALCAESRHQGYEAPWPMPNGTAAALRHWIGDFSRGLTPAQALNQHNSIEPA